MIAPLLAALLAVGPKAAPRNDAVARERARSCLEAERGAAVTVCREALEASLPAPWSAAVFDELALRLATLKRWDELVALYRERARKEPANAETQRRLGAALLHAQNRPEEAAAALKEAVRLKPDDAEAWATLGVAWNALGRQEEAVNAFSEAERLDPAYFERRPAARLTLEASRRGERWP